MGSVKKALKPVTRVIDDIIPNEIKPALPYIAATFGAPYLSPLVGKGLGALGMKALSPAITKGLAGGLANIGTRAALGKKFNPASALFSAATIGGGQFLKDASMFQDSTFAKSLGEFISPDKLGGMNLTQVSSAATTPLTAGTAESAYDAAKKANDEYEQYLQEQEAAGNEDIQTRIDYITRYMGLAGFDQDKINETLNDLGYAANGGLMGTRIGYEMGGISDLSKLFYKVTGKEESEESLMNRKNQYAKEIANEMFQELDDPYPSRDTMKKITEEADRQAEEALNEYMKSIGMDPFNPPEGSMEDEMIDEIMEPRKEGRVKEAMGGRIKYAEGGLEERGKIYSDYLDKLEEKIKDPNLTGDEATTIMDQLKEIRKMLNTGKKDGGIMNLKMGGMPAEMDLRPGGFVPLGAKERADDVPARLSKNEFVMTADAVRAAGGGSVNKGAKRMYDLMNKLEARV